MSGSVLAVCEAAVVRMIPPVRPQPETVWVYFAQAGAEGIVKVGSSVDVKRRLATLRVRSPDLVLRRVITGGRKWERLLHQALAPWRLEGEWFRPAPEVTALFEMPEDRIREWVLDQRSALAAQRHRSLSRKTWATGGRHQHSFARHVGKL